MAGCPFPVKKVISAVNFSLSTVPGPNGPSVDGTSHSQYLDSLEEGIRQDIARFQPDLFVRERPFWGASDGRPPNIEDNALEGVHIRWHGSA